jgi:hypothetical protein
MRRDDIRRLSEQRKQVFATMHKLNEDAEKENRNLSAEENEQFEKMAVEFEDLKAREDRAVKLFMQDREVEKTMTTPIEHRLGDEGDAAATLNEYRTKGMVPRQDEPEYRNAFWHHLVAHGSELDVEEQRALSKGTTTAGGFLVPTSMANEIIRSSRDMGAIATALQRDPHRQTAARRSTCRRTRSTVSLRGRLSRSATPRRMRRSRTSRSARTRAPRRSSSPRSSSPTRSSTWSPSSRRSSVSVSASSRTRRSCWVTAPASPRASCRRLPRRT